MRLPVLAALMAGLSIAGCGPGEPRPVVMHQTLTIRGPAAEVDRFIEALTRLHPGIVVAERTTLADDQSRVMVTLPPSTSGDLATDIAKAGMSARLSVGVSSRS